MPVIERMIPDFPGYEVDRLGNVYSRWIKNGRRPAFIGTKRKLLSPSYSGRYAQVSLSKCGRIHYRKVHILVLTVFVGPKPEGLQGCHNDGDTTNNRLSNLRCDTPKGNYNDRRFHGTANDGVRNGRAKLTDADVIGIKRLLAIGVAQTRIGNIYGVSQVKISQIKLGKAWRHLTK